MPVRPITFNAIASINNKNLKTKKNTGYSQSVQQLNSFQPSFKGAFGYEPFISVPKSVLSSLHVVNLEKWDRKIICEAFDNIVNEIKNNPQIQKTEGFNHLYKMYKTNGLRGMLHSLGQPNSENLKKIASDINIYSDTYVAPGVILRNEGPYGFFKSLFGSKNSQNKIVLRFWGKDAKDISFNLDKAGDFQVGIDLDAEKWAYYADKDAVKKQVCSKFDIAVPPGV